MGFGELGKAVFLFWQYRNKRIKWVPRNSSGLRSYPSIQKEGYGSPGYCDDQLRLPVGNSSGCDKGAWAPLIIHGQTKEAGWMAVLTWCPHVPLGMGQLIPNVLLDYALDMVRVVYEEGLDRPGPRDHPDCIWNNGDSWDFGSQRVWTSDLASWEVLVIIRYFCLQAFFISSMVHFKDHW